MLRRTGFGATGPEIDAALGTPASVLVTSALATDPSADPGAVATPLPSLEVLPSPGRQATAAERKAQGERVDEQLQQLSRWWLLRMVSVRQPVHERLTLMWHNHFATSAAKVRVAASLATQNQRLRDLGLGDFRTLAFAMLTDPAMLIWLDANQNSKKAANENLAREFMELFALGHGNGYTENDVRAGARALTGWTVTKAGAAQFVPKRHDDGVKTVLGVTGPLGIDEFCDAVLAQPRWPGYVATRVWQHLASDTAPSAEALSRLTAAYGAGRDLRALATAVWTDPEFLAGRATVVAAPVEWLIGGLRALRVPMTTQAKKSTIEHPDHATGVLKSLGQAPFYPPDVGGWPSGQAWMSTAAAATRLSVATQIADAGDVSAVDEAARADRLDAVGHLLGIGEWSDVTARALRPLAGNPRRLTAAALVSPEYLTS